MRLALWTAAPERWSGLPPNGADSFLLATDPTGARPAGDLDVYHLQDDPACGFVLRALLDRPGIVLLEDGSLHALVHAETAGRGDEAGYLQAARRCGGARGAFIARQVLRGLGGALLPLLALDDDVLEAALALVVADRALQERVLRAVRGRPLRVCSLAKDGPAAVAAAVLALAREILPQLEARRAAFEARRSRPATAAGRALAELRPLARELGLPEPPAGAWRAVASLFGAAGPPAEHSGR